MKINSKEIDNIVFNIVFDISEIQFSKYSLKYSLKEYLKFCKTNFALLYNTIEEEFNIVLKSVDERSICTIEDIVKAVKLKISNSQI